MHIVVAAWSQVGVVVLDLLIQHLFLPGEADLSESIEEKLDASVEVLALVRQVVLRAPLSGELRCSVELVSRHLREEVVLDLVVETAGEPVHDGSRFDVARGVNLEVYEVELASIVGIVRLASVVRGEDNDGNEAAANAVREEPPGDGGGDGGHGEG